jgi:hypothetical protein
MLLNFIPNFFRWYVRSLGTTDRTVVTFNIAARVASAPAGPAVVARNRRLLAPVIAIGLLVRLWPNKAMVSRAG